MNKSRYQTNTDKIPSNFPGMEKKRPMDIRVFSGSQPLPSNRMIPVVTLPAPPFGHVKLWVHDKSRVCCFVCGKLVSGESAEAKEATRSIDRSVHRERQRGTRGSDEGRCGVVVRWSGAVQRAEAKGSCWADGRRAGADGEERSVGSPFHAFRPWSSFIRKCSCTIRPSFLRRRKRKWIRRVWRRASASWRCVCVCV